MDKNAEKVDPLFLQLVLSLQSAAMYQMGKTVSPISGKIEKDMSQAKISIDLLSMLQGKTRGNLHDEEKRILDSLVYNLQMNYVDELEREKTEAETDKKSPDKEDAPEKRPPEHEEDDRPAGQDTADGTERKE